MKENKDTRIVIGMSGGVDSSVAAYLLQQEGYDVVGVFMKNWEEKDDDGYCTALEDFEDVVEVSEKLDLPYELVNFEKEYWDRVFTYFLDEYKRGRTPNPDVMCNKEIKFKAFLEHAETLGADYIAMGHYAAKDVLEGKARLLRAKDLNKDQTYFLCGLNQSQIAKAVFPLAEVTKPEVREIAEKLELSTAKKKDSTGICFIGERDFNAFLDKFLPAQPGKIVTPQGQVMGDHEGLLYYTIGQRKGLGIGGKGTGEPWFVIDKNIQTNELIVVQGKKNPKRYKSALEAEKVSWIADEPPAESFTCTAKFRYRQPDQGVDVKRLEGDRWLVTFHEKQAGIAPGQVVAFYDGRVCLGGGIIDFAID